MQIVFKLFRLPGYLLKIKTNIRFLLAALKHLLILKIAPKKPHKCSCFPSLSSVIFSKSTFVAGFRNNFLEHMRLSEQLMEGAGGNRKAERAYEEGYWKDFHN
jgi:hypothetical protein